MRAGERLRMLMAGRLARQAALAPGGARRKNATAGERPADGCLRAVCEPGWLVRLREERRELGVRIGRLEGFIQGSAVFGGMGDSSRRLLYRQLRVMLEYLEVLDERIYWGAFDAELAARGVLDGGDVE